MERLRRSWLPWLILAVSLAITWQAWERERRLANEQLKEHFDDAIQETISRIEQRMAAYEQLLRGVQAQYAGTGRTDRDALRGYVGAIQSDANFAGILAIGYAHWVPADRKQAHVAAMRRLGFADYRIWPEGARDGYAPVDQREPDSSRDRFQFGYDPWSEPVRRHAMARARDSGMIAVSGKLRLVVDKDAQAPGFLMYLPVYARGQPVDNLAQRRAALIGWYFGAFRMSDVMAGLYGSDSPGLALAIHDGIDLSDASLLFRSAAGNAASIAPVYSSDEYLVVGGHTWTLTVSATKEFAARFHRDDASLIAWSGIGLSMSLALIAWLLVGSEARAHALAEKMTQDLRESERRWAFALEGAGDGVWDWNLQTHAVVTSKRWKEIVGCSDVDAVETIDEWEARVHPDDRPRVIAAMESIQGLPRETGSTYVAEYRVRCGDDRWRWVLARGMVVERTSDGRPLRMIGTISDIDERKATEVRMRHMAQHDPLTDLPNRALFSDRVQRELAHAARHNERFALIFLDLDEFKPVNDNHGHAVGDQVLRQAAVRILESLRAEDTVGRIGGDEFVILVSRLRSPSDALALAEKVREAMRRPFEVDCFAISISCSLGVAVYPEDGTDEITLSKNADYAMYRAKDAGGDSVRMNAAQPEAGETAGADSE